VKQHALGSAPGLVEAQRTPAVRRSAGGTGEGMKAKNVTFFSATNGEVLLSTRKRRAHQVKQHALGSAPGLKEAMRTSALRRSAGGTGQRRKAELAEVTFFPLDLLANGEEEILVTRSSFRYPRIRIHPPRPLLIPTPRATSQGM